MTASFTITVDHGMAELPSFILIETNLIHQDFTKQSE
jgi:hypothetical protein